MYISRKKKHITRVGRLKVDVGVAEGDDAATPKRDYCSSASYVVVVAAAAAAGGNPPVLAIFIVEVSRVCVCVCVWDV